jgi:trehalose 6-phosphate synthase
MALERNVASTNRMRVRQLEPTLLKPGEPDGYGAWTSERLEGWLRASGQEPVLVLAHRAPPTSGHDSIETRLARPSTSGPVTAVEPLIRACSGVWLAHGTEMEIEAAGGTNGHPIGWRDSRPFRVQRIQLKDDEERSHYYGFTNEALWPMCHRAHVKPIFRPDDFTTYWSVNARFADAACDQATSDSPLVLVQDYHFAMTPQLLRERMPESRIVTFWHIPWPDWQTFEICPWGRYILEGLLGSSIVGFQTPLDCRNFIETVERCLGAHVDRHEDALTFAGRHVLVKAYPASVRWPDMWASCSPPVDVCRDGIRRQLGLPADTLLGVGVDRLDHTKGIEEKFLAVERLLECYPEFRRRFVLVQLAAPVRECLPAYRDLRSRVYRARDLVNERFGCESYQPILLLEDHHAPPHVNLFLRAADVCYVGSLHDGMNLVAKEFVSARDDERGVLVLSMFAGAARELTEALHVNPYDVDDAASVLARALTMTADDQADRMRRMRLVVSEFSAWRWAAQILSDAARLRRER